MSSMSRLSILLAVSSVVAPVAAFVPSPRHGVAYSVVQAPIHFATPIKRDESVKDDAVLKEFQESPPKILGEAFPYSDLTIGVLKETYDLENRVSQSPDSVKMLVKAGFNVVVEEGGMLICLLI